MCKEKIIQKIPSYDRFSSNSVLSAIPLGTVKLKFYNEKNEIEIVEINAELTHIGRKEDSSYEKSIMFHDKSISGKHCLIKVEWDIDNQMKRIFVNDQNSSNGTKINTTSLTPKVDYLVNDHDVLQLGNFQILVLIS